MWRDSVLRKYDSIVSDGECIFDSSADKNLKIFLFRTIAETSQGLHRMCRGSCDIIVVRPRTLPGQCELGGDVAVDRFDR